MPVRTHDHAGAAGHNPDATRSSLIHRLRDWGDHGSWQVFFDTYWKLIYAVAIKAGLSDTEARDVVQETVVAVAKQMREAGYDRSRSSFKNWLCLITRRRIIDHFRKRSDPKRRPSPPADDDTRRTDTAARVPDPASLELDTVWEEEWQKNLLDAAIERVKHRVSPKQFQIFDLSILRELPVAGVKTILKVNAAQVYLARHRVGALVPLLNRVGVGSGNDLGYADAGLNATFTDTAANNIHFYQSVIGYSITGGAAWQPDGRTINPVTSSSASFDAAETASLAAYNGMSADGDWTLVLADVSAGGGQATVLSWGLDIAVVPEPSTYFAAAGALALMLCGLKKGLLPGNRRSPDIR